MNKKLKRLEQIFEAMGRSHAVIGVIGGTHTDEDGNTFGMPGLAAAHEFGNKHLPERSFLRSSLLENKELYKRQLAALMKQVVRGEITPDEAYNKMGAIAAGKAQEVILNGDLAALKPETIRRKGSSKPLIDTGQLVQSITWDIR